MSRNGETPGGIQLRVLGRILLRRDGDEVGRVLAQPKRFAVLAYVLLLRPGGFVRRDELLGIFWPDSDEARARAALRQALRFLRRHLGDDVIENRGDEEIRVPPGAIDCDAIHLVEALEAGDHQRAMDFYAGDLLPGFILAGSYEFQRWMQAERQKLRAAAIRAALRHADGAEARDDTEAASEHVRRALALEPTHEGVARRLIEVLARVGDRTGAMEVFASMEARLEQELDLEPSPETLLLIDRVRAGAVPVVPGGSGGDSTGTPSARRVLVVALENLTGDASFDAVGRLAAEVLAQGIATIGGLEVVPPMIALGMATRPVAATGRPATPAGSPHVADLELARRVGAGTLVGGTYYRQDETLHFQARVTDVPHDRLLQAPDPVAGPVSAPLGALADLRDRVMVGLATALTRRTVHVREAAPPPSMSAYLAYSDGLELFIRGRWRPALAHFRRASRMQPDWALPGIVCAIALWNLEELEAARRVAAAAAELRPSLGRFESAVLDMVLAWLRGDWAAAHEAARVQAELAPGSIPHFQVAEEARRLNRPREAREVLSALDPESGELRGWIFYWIELTAAEHALGEHERELELASRCRRLHPDSPVAALLEIRALAALGRGAEIVRLLDQSLATPGHGRPSPGALHLEAALELATHGHGSEADGLPERAVEWYRDRVVTEPTEDVRRGLARALYHAGDPESASHVFEELAAASEGGVRPVGYHHGHLQAHLDAGYLAVIAARRGHEAGRARWTRWLRELDQPFLYGANWFWLAAVAAEEGDRGRAVTCLRRAFADGLPHEGFLHTDPHLRRLRGHPPFDALLRPRG